MNRPYYTTGTTTLAIKCKDGVVIGADTRVTSGYFIAHKRGRKIFMIKPHIAVTIAGVVADAQAAIEELKFHLNYYENTYGRRLPAKSAANYLSLILYSNRLYPLITEVIVAGKDSDGYAIYKLDPLGSLIKDDYTVSGSGSMVAIGILESEYKPDLTVGDGVKLAAKALISAMKRDIASGDDFMIATITEDGYKELPLEERESLLKGLELKT
jgi:proteasome beta subunit